MTQAVILKISYLCTSLVHIDLLAEEVFAEG